MFLTTGAFVRGTFTDGRVSKNCYMRVLPEYAYMMRVDFGVLEGKSTVFDLENKSLRVVEYEQGDFVRHLKSFEKSTVEDCHKNLCQQVFGYEVGTTKRLSEAARRLKDSAAGPCIGSFPLPEKAWYYGCCTRGAPNGLGLLIDCYERVEIGWFEAGKLSGYGRRMNPKGVNMDGYFIETTLNREIIMYTPAQNDWIISIFSDNILEKELAKGTGFPTEEKKAYFARHFDAPASLSFAALEISPEIFCFDEEQEAVFYLAYGRPWPDKCPSHLKFQLSGEQKIVFDSKKDIEELRVSGKKDDILAKVESGKMKQSVGSNQLSVPEQNSRRSSHQNDFDYGHKLSQHPVLPGASKPPKNSWEASQADPAEPSAAKHKKQVQAFPQASHPQPDVMLLVQRAANASKPQEASAQKPRHSRELNPLPTAIDTEEVISPKGVFSLSEDPLEREEEASNAYQQATPINLLRRDPRLPQDASRQPPAPKPQPLLQEPSAQSHTQQANNSQARGRPDKKTASQTPIDSSRYPMPALSLDRIDMMMIKRASNWDTDKTLNPKNRIEKKPTTGQTVGKEAKSSVVSNYIEDYLLAFVDPSRIDKMMRGIEGYQEVKNKYI